jgi:hypothetical protein
MLCNLLCNMHALHSNIATSVSVGSLNNNRTVISSTYAWRPLACLPILKTSAFSNVNKDWHNVGLHFTSVQQCYGPYSCSS